MPTMTVVNMHTHSCMMNGSHCMLTSQQLHSNDYRVVGIEFQHVVIILGEGAVEQASIHVPKGTLPQPALDGHLVAVYLPLVQFPHRVLVLVAGFPCHEDNIDLSSLQWTKTNLLYILKGRVGITFWTIIRV